MNDEKQCDAVQVKRAGTAVPEPTHYVIHDRQHCPNRYDPLGTGGQHSVIAFGSETEALTAAKAFVERVGGQVTIVETVRKVYAKARVDHL